MNNASLSARIKAVASQLWKAVRHILFHNGWVKLLAVLISLLLWAGLISQDDTLTRDKTWQNVKISVTGAEKIKNNGYIVVSDLGPFTAISAGSTEGVLIYHSLYHPFW